MEQLAGLLPDRLHHLRNPVAADGGEDAAEEVEVAAALGVPDVTPLAVVDGDGLLVIERLPFRHDRPMARGELGVAHRQASMLVITCLIRV